MAKRKFGAAIAAGIAATGAAATGASAQAQEPAGGHAVTVAVKAVQTAPPGGAGPLYVSLQNETQFMKNDGAYGDIIRQPADGAIDVVIEGVAAGRYAVTVWHDIDGDGVFDRAENGRPLDGWAMSADTADGPPLFADASVAVDRDVVVTVHMQYKD